MNNLTFNSGDSYFLLDELYEELFGFLKFPIDIDLVKTYLLELSYEDKIVFKNEDANGGGQGKGDGSQRIWEMGVNIIKISL